MKHFISGPKISLKDMIELRYISNFSLFKNNLSRSNMSGGHRSSFRGRGMDFDEARPYQAGDDVRNIDWRVTARTSITHTKIFKEEKDRPVILAVDQSSSMFFGSKVTYKSVIAAELAAIISWSGLKNNDKVGGIVFNDYEHVEIKPKRSKNALLSLLKNISDFNSDLFEFEKNEGRKIDFGIHNALEKIKRISKPGSAIFIISDFSGYDEEAEKLLYIINRHADVYALFIADTMEENLPERSQLSVTDGKQKTQLNTASDSLRFNYQQHFQKKLNALESSFKKLKIPCRRVWTSDDPRQALLGFAKPPAVQTRQKPTHAA